MGTNPESRGPNCPDDDALRDLAAGLCPPDQASQLTQHAAQCAHCGPLLRMYIENFSDEFNDEDEALLGQLKSSSAAWQKNMARKMLAQSGASRVSSESVAPAGKAGARTPFPWRWVLAPTALALAACTVIPFAVLYARRDTPEKVDTLLAQAYTEDRQLEMRIPYAMHAEIHQRRSGDAESLLSLPASLHKATNAINTQLEKHPEDPRWLLLSARLDLLDWHYKPALATLTKIEDAKVLDSPEMLVTRALAFYEKGESEHEPQAYGEAADLLGKALQKTPDDPVALFNQAIACEKNHSYGCAISDYERVMAIEKGSGWSDEAAERLNQINQKKSHAQ